MFFQPNIGINLRDLTHKRKFNEDLTSNLPPMDLSVPTDLPQPNQPVIPMAQKGPSKLDILSKILEAAASGYAVSQSDNPSQTLMQQIMQRRQEAQQRQNQEYEAAQRERQYQFETQKQQTQIGAQKAEQKSEQEFKKGLQESQQKHEVSLNSQEFANKKDLQAQHAQAQEALTRLEAGFQLNRDSNNQEFQMQLQKARDAGDLKQVQIKTVMGALLSASKYHSPAPIERVMNIVTKIQNDQALDKEDTAIINHAIKVNAAANSGVSVGGKVGLQNLKGQQRSDLELMKDDSRMIQEMVKQSVVVERNPLNGQVNVIRTPPDVLEQQIRDMIRLRRSIVGSPSGTIQNGKEVINLTNPAPADIQQGELQVVNNVKNFLDSGGDPNSINMSALPPNLKQQVQNLINQKKRKFGSTFGR